MAPEVVLEVKADRCKEEIILDVVDGGSSLRQFDSKALVTFENVSSASSDRISWNKLTIFWDAPAIEIYEDEGIDNCLLVSGIIWQTIFTNFFSKAFSTGSVLLEYF